MLIDRDVVGLADERLGERGGERAVAQVEAMAARLEVDDHVGVRERVADRGLDRVGRAVALDDRLAGRHGDHGVGEVPCPPDSRRRRRRSSMPSPRR